MSNMKYVTCATIKQWLLGIPLATMDEQILSLLSYQNIPDLQW